MERAMHLFPYGGFSTDARAYELQVSGLPRRFLLQNIGRAPLGLYRRQSEDQEGQGAANRVLGPI